MDLADAFIQSDLQLHSVYTFFISMFVRGLHGLKTEARTRPVPEIVWPEPTRPDPSGTVKFRARTRPEIPPRISDMCVRASMKAAKPLHIVLV